MENLAAKHWQEFAASIGLPERTATAANKTALAAALSINLEALPYAEPPERCSQGPAHGRTQLGG